MTRWYRNFRINQDFIPPTRLVKQRLASQLIGSAQSHCIIDYFPHNRESLGSRHGGQNRDNVLVQWLPYSLRRTGSISQPTPFPLVILLRLSGSSQGNEATKAARFPLIFFAFSPTLHRQKGACFNETSFSLCFSLYFHFLSFLLTTPFSLPRSFVSTLTGNNGRARCVRECVQQWSVCGARECVPQGSVCSKGIQMLFRGNTGSLFPLCV